MPRNSECLWEQTSDCHTKKACGEEHATHLSAFGITEPAGNGKACSLSPLPENSTPALQLGWARFLYKRAIERQNGNHFRYQRDNHCESERIKWDNQPGSAYLGVRNLGQSRDFTALAGWLKLQLGKFLRAARTQPPPSLVQDTRLSPKFHLGFDSRLRFSKNETNIWLCTVRHRGYLDKQEPFPTRSQKKQRIRQNRHTKWSTE